jgi:hypothetical protein
MGLASNRTVRVVDERPNNYHYDNIISYMRYALHKISDPITQSW